MIFPLIHNNFVYCQPKEIIDAFTNIFSMSLGVHVAKKKAYKNEIFVISNSINDEKTEMKNKIVRLNAFTSK